MSNPVSGLFRDSQQRSRYPQVGTPQPIGLISTSPSKGHSVSDLQPDAHRLPYEILQVILECYSIYRVQEIQNLYEDRGGRTKLKYGIALGPRWPVLPILQTCSSFRDLMIPFVYRTVVTLNNPALGRFLSQPAFSSYRHLKELSGIDAANSGTGPQDQRPKVDTVRLRGSSAGLVPKLRPLSVRRGISCRSYLPADRVSSGSRYNTW